MRRIGFYLFIIAVFLPQKAVPAPAAAPTPTPTAVARAAAPYRAVWVSYLEWEQVDFSSAEAFTQAIAHSRYFLLSVSLCMPYFEPY